MANTSITEVMDSFSTLISDYRLVSLYNSSQTDFTTYLQSWLEFAITDFSICNQSLEFDETTKLFTVILTRENKTILAQLMVKYWLMKLVQDVLQMNTRLQDRDFHTYAESANLKEKSAHLDAVKETCSQSLISYGYRNTDWEALANQTFEV
jgi:hypothetical protein